MSDKEATASNSPNWSIADIKIKETGDPLDLSNPDNIPSGWQVETIAKLDKEYDTDNKRESL